MTTIEEVKQAISDIQNLMDEGKFIDAFEKYYADDVVMEDNANGTTVGKDANRTREEEIFSNMEWYKVTPINRVFGSHDGYDVVVVTIMENDFKHKQFGEIKSLQSAITYWKDGKITREQFYYSM